jgi:mono/diheme cytochrome c family protein
MDSRTLTATIAAATLFGTAAVAQAQDKPKVDFGKVEYESNCAACHGITGKGDGPMKPLLTKSPPDITMIEKNNHGVFPFQKTYELIDGRRTVPAHGTREMPVWGQDYLARSGYREFPYAYDADVYVRSRILALIDYMERIQAR